MLKHKFILQSDGIELEELSALGLLDEFSTRNVDFLDAYLARKSQDRSLSIITRNKKHFKRLDCEFYTPEDLINH